MKKTKKPQYVPYRPRKKKAFGQHFLREQWVVDRMIDAVSVGPETPVMEIGCGDGFLTRAILQQTPCKKLRVIEIDPEWAAVVDESIDDDRLEISVTDVLELDWSTLSSDAPWVLLANLPYQISFPILFKMLEHRTLFSEGVIMVQEEVAQKMASTSGKKYTPTSLRLQHAFEFKLLDKIDPKAFVPPPKVRSRLVYFKPRPELVAIPDDELFWKFLSLCFQFPRQTLRNNLKGTHYFLDVVPEDVAGLRAQQLSFEQLLTLWQLAREQEER